ncbi:hypothetical protein FJY63_12480 [Candidatus Sumerlaeota bacterium]|nr:hypothetical protein [Candidatus Sumerlaeota bacterium]
MSGQSVPADGDERSEAKAGSSADEVSSGPLDVVEVMARIRSDIAEDGKSPACSKDPLLSQGTDLLQLEGACATVAERLLYLQRLARLDLQGEPVVSCRPVVGCLINLAKRITRWRVRKYTDGLFARQSNFNSELVSVLSEMNRQIEHLRAEIERLKKGQQSPPEGER